MKSFLLSVEPLIYLGSEIWKLLNEKALPDWPPSLDKFADALRDATLKIPGIKDLAYTKKATSISGKPALFAYMPYSDPKHDAMIEHTILYVQDGYMIWAIRIAYMMNDEETRSAASPVQ